MSSDRIPTLAEKVKMYEDFLHRISLYCNCGNNEAIRKLVQNADAFSYAHRVGNGEYSDEEQDRIVAAKFWKLLDIEDR
jgi:hypothetical protein